MRATNADWQEMEVNIYVEGSLFHVTDIFVMVYHQVLPLAQGYLFSGKL